MVDTSTARCALPVRPGGRRGSSCAIGRQGDGLHEATLNSLHALKRVFAVEPHFAPGLGEPVFTAPDAFGAEQKFRPALRD